MVYRGDVIRREDFSDIRIPVRTRSGRNRYKRPGRVGLVSDTTWVRDRGTVVSNGFRDRCAVGASSAEFYTVRSGLRRSVQKIVPYSRFRHCVYMYIYIYIYSNRRLNVFVKLFYVSVIIFSKNVIIM